MLVHQILHIENNLIFGNETGEDELVDLETSKTEIAIESSNEVDYSQAYDNLLSVSLFIIVFIGVICGLISAKIMWGKIHV